MVGTRWRTRVDNRLGVVYGPVLMTTTTFPLETLLQKADVTVSSLREDNDADFQAVIGTLRRGKGNLTFLQADRLAIRFGYHPAEVWAGWIDVDWPDENDDEDEKRKGYRFWRQRRYNRTQQMRRRVTGTTRKN